MSPTSAAGANVTPSRADVTSRRELQERARAVLRQLAAHPDEILAADSTKELVPLAAALAKAQTFNYARQLIAWAKRAPTGDETLRRELGQKHALYTYKDSDLPVLARLQRALELLGEIEDLSSSTDQETLGLAGAIYKRLWDVDGRPETLERSSRCYLRGFEAGERRGRGSLPDDGYTGINAAFVLDLLAAAEEREAAGDKETTEYVSARRAKAEAIRRTIVSGLTSRVGAPISAPAEWWRVLTLAEGYFGLGQYDLAREQLRRAAAAKALMSPWVYESSARQFASLARLRAAVDGSPDAANAVLTELVGDQDSALRSASIGKVGLALSGGGFRASFFHIGVLAWLAERGVLPAVEVLSCVSGGSILGAQYYLMVRDLLQRRRDRDVTEQDYVDLVEQLQREFLAGVQRNVRTRALAELSTSLRMIVQPHYARTRRLGELYEKLLYARVQDGGGTQERWLDSLFINPPDTSGFSPPRDNWMRSTKVPILVVNATALNTGHNWQFTASWMGEPPESVDAETDINDRLRRMYYDQAPGRYKRMRLGRAVAASSCVPGLFEPIAFPRLYPDRTVSLVDGGVHDNQGAASLLDQDCTVLLISDASGQMKSEAKPGGDAVSVLKRSNDVLMARVRGAQYRDLATRRSASLLRGLMFLHLKKDLDVTPVEWVDSDEPIDPDDTR